MVLWGLAGPLGVEYLQAGTSLLLGVPRHIGLRALEGCQSRQKDRLVNIRHTHIGTHTLVSLASLVVLGAPLPGPLGATDIAG